MQMASELNVGQVQLTRQLLQHAALRPVPSHNQAEIWQSLHRVQQIVHAFLSGQPAEIKQRGVLCTEPH